MISTKKKKAKANFFSGPRIKGKKKCTSQKGRKEDAHYPPAIGALKVNKSLYHIRGFQMTPTANRWISARGGKKSNSGNNVRNKDDKLG